MGDVEIGIEKEVYVDFSSLDEEIIEEVVEQSGATADNTVPSTLDRLQSSMPPGMAQALDNLIDSYNKNRKAYLIGLGVFLAFLIVAIIAAFMFFNNSASHSPSITRSFTKGPFPIPP